MLISVRRRVSLLVSAVLLGFWACGPLAAASRRILNVWAMGEEGLKIAVMARKFEAENPGVRVVTQAIPWDAAHEKLLTTVVGRMPPDVCQLGTTWMAEFATLEALEPLESYIQSSSVVRQPNFFPGSWKTAIVDNRVFGVPWYVDTRVLFYRKDLLAEVGFKKPPETWDQLKKACRLLTADLDHDGKIDRYGMPLPVRGWGDFLPYVWQNGGDPMRPADPKFKEVLKFYLSFFQEHLTPLGNAADMDLFQAFKTGFYPMFVSGPWMVELIHKEVPELDGKWAVAMLPGKVKRTSFVGGCNLVLFRDSKQKDLGWKFIEFMSRPDVQLEWYHIMKDLPAVRQTWDVPELRNHPMLSVFGEQMKDTDSPPAIPEWEQISDKIDNHMEAIILGDKSAQSDQGIQQELNALQKEMEDIRHKPRIPQVKTRHFVGALLVVGFVVFLAFYIQSKSRSWRRTLRGVQQITQEARRADWSKSLYGYIFILPALVILALFLFVPLVFSFLISLTNWNIYGLANPTMVGFVGLQNYQAVFKDPIFWKSLWNTLLFTAAGVPFTVLISLVFASVLNEKFVRFKTFFRTSYFVPVVSTIVAVAVIWKWLYNPEYGLLNWVLKSLSLHPLNWLADPKTSLASLILMAVWKNFGYNMIIFLAGLQAIPEALYESAMIDGANAWQLFLNVTLPGLRPTMVFVVVMSTIGYLQLFAEPYVMTKGGPLNSTMSIVLYMYNQGFKFFQLGYASALAYVLFGIIFLFTFAQIKFRKSGFTVA